MCQRKSQGTPRKTLERAQGIARNALDGAQGEPGGRNAELAMQGLTSDRRVTPYASGARWSPMNPEKMARSMYQM